jgi:acyl-coenzyme A synthetase/AMP-(fatty) acid ligase
MSCELYLLLLAILRLGAVAVFIEPGMKRADMRAAIALADARAFVGIPKAHLLRIAWPVVRQIPLFLWARGRALSRKAASRGQEHSTLAVPPEHPALLTFTSGSTGAPKGIVRTHGALLAQHRALARVLNMSAGSVDLPGLPIVLLNTLAAGATAIIPPIGKRVSDTDPAQLAQLIREHKVETASGSPALFRPLADYADQHQIQFPSLKRVFIGGAPVPPALLYDLAPLLPNGDTCVVYGSSEAEPISHIDGRSVLAETAAMTARGYGLCVGEPVPEVKLRLDDGEILVAGDHVNEHYFNNPEAERVTKVRDDSGVVWHRTGDVGRLDEQGRLWLMGRCDDVIKRNGQQVHATAVEMAARSRPGVTQAALLDVDGRAVLVIEGTQPDLGELRALHTIIDDVQLMGRIPTDRRHNAKIDYAALRRQLQQ